MTPKQRRFADEYLIDLNATRAYKTAYPYIKNDDVAAVNASRLLKNIQVQEYVSERIKQISNAKLADAKEVMEYLTSVLRGQSTAEIVVVEGVGDGCSLARIINKAPDEKERLKAAELLGKRYGLFTDKVNIGGEVIIIHDDLPDDDDD